MSSGFSQIFRFDSGSSIKLLSSKIENMFLQSIMRVNYFFLVIKTSYVLSRLRFFPSPMVPQIRCHKSLLGYIIEPCVFFAL